MEPSSFYRTFSPHGRTCPFCFPCCQGYCSWLDKICCGWLIISLSMIAIELILNYSLFCLARIIKFFWLIGRYHWNPHQGCCDYTLGHLISRMLRYITQLSWLHAPIGRGHKINTHIFRYQCPWFCISSMLPCSDNIKNFP